MNPTIFVLLFVLWTNEGPKPLVGMFEDKVTCEVTMGEMMTRAAADDTIVGFEVPVKCDAVSKGIKASLK